MINEINHLITQIYILLDENDNPIKDAIMEMQDTQMMLELRKAYKERQYDFRDSLSLCSCKLASLSEVLEDIQRGLRKEKQKHLSSKT